MSASDFLIAYCAGAVAYGIAFIVRLVKTVRSPEVFHDGKTFAQWLNSESQFLPEMVTAFVLALATVLAFFVSVSAWPLWLGLRIARGKPIF